MKPPAVGYARPGDSGGLALLASLATTRRALAGGQSLVPLMNFRLARPSSGRHQPDRRARLDAHENGSCALARWPGSATSSSATPPRRGPLLRRRCATWGTSPIRNRGTVGGSLAHADPAAELPAVVTALGRELVLEGPGGTRPLGPTTSSLAPSRPPWRPTSCWSRSGCPARRRNRRRQSRRAAGMATSPRRGALAAVHLADEGTGDLVLPGASGVDRSRSGCTPRRPSLTGTPPAADAVDGRVATVDGASIRPTMSTRRRCTGATGRPAAGQRAAGRAGGSGPDEPLERKQTISVTVNGHPTPPTSSRESPLGLPAGPCGLTGTHSAVSTASAVPAPSCGRPTARSCLMLAVQADGSGPDRRGARRPRRAAPVQQAFWDSTASSAASAPPGMLITATALLSDNPDPTEAEIRECFNGNLCRCTGYDNILRAVQDAAGRMRG